MLPAVDAPSPAKVHIGSTTEPTPPMTKDRYDIPIPKEINYIWLGRTFEKFEHTPIQECVKNNPDYRVRLWIDDFSMLEMDGPCGLPRVFPPASLKIYTSGINEAVSSAHINTTFAMVVRAQIEYYKVRLKDQLREQISTVRKFHSLIRTHLPTVDLRYLSDFYEALFQAEHQKGHKSFAYPSLHPSSLAARWENLGPELRLLEWALFERYRGHYAAASNLVRVLLLQSHPGVYADHRSTVPALGDLSGFRFALTSDRTPTQHFLAAAPAHPCLQYFRYRILQNYDVLLYNHFRCGALDYTTLAPPADLSAPCQDPYLAETYFLSGPGAFFRAVKEVAEGGLGEGVVVGGAGVRGVGGGERGVEG